MKKEAVRGFAARIAQANRSQLTVILYDIILTDIEEARKAHSEQDIDTFCSELKQAQRFVSELMATLDYRYRISYELLSLYLYVNKCIITAIMRKDPLPLKGAGSVMEKLQVGFEGICKGDKSSPLMRNTQQLYAGLTYGKGTLNETLIDPNSINRGYVT